MIWYLAVLYFVVCGRVMRRTEGPGPNATFDLSAGGYLGASVLGCACLSVPSHLPQF